MASKAQEIISLIPTLQLFSHIVTRTVLTHNIDWSLCTKIQDILETQIQFYGDPTDSFRFNQLGLSYIWCHQSHK